MSTLKNLYIVRHGKSTTDYANIKDYDRPLKERGISDGYSMSQHLVDKGEIPDLIISSPAIRALHTATIFARKFKYPFDKIIINKDIYIAESKTMLNIIAQSDNKIQSLMIFGHNPTFTDLANHFLTMKIDNLPTAGIVGLSFEIDSWSDIINAKPIDSFFDYPKNIF